MRLVTYEARGRLGVGARVGDDVIDTGFADMLTLIEGGDRALDQASAAVERGEVVAVDRLLAPIPRPHQVLFHSVNFQSLVDETEGCPVPQRSSWFSKLPSSVIGDGDAIHKPAPDTHLDWEVELAIVIGRTTRRVAPEDVAGLVFGYTVVNDISARDIQLQGGDIMLGKGCDTFCPMGPEIVTADEIGDADSLALSTYLNDERVQHERLDGAYFSTGENVAALSRFVTLQPGDLVTTGSPAGIGMNMRPPRWLVPGDTIAVEAEGIGRVTNTVVAGW